ncbi:uncharacterized protein LOC131162644 [Malania oleifera]|uniref:uncharacterized protein LOC131162644 n=1 Tax=Malania oleifera TaxID=397392 RepID=UPI0025AEBCD1|nr:uncharacterized protein LOC131162644 [Malania oleifera]
MDTSNEDDTNASTVLRSIARQAKKEARREQDQPLADRGCTFQQFTWMSLPAFVGGADPIITKDWIQEMEELLIVLHCTDEQRVQYATFKLVGEVKRWWRLTKLVEEQRPGYSSIIWSHFREYAAKFVKLTRFAPHMVANEPLKAWMFERGLRQGIRTQVVALLTQSFFELVDKAMAVEANIQESEAGTNQKKRCGKHGHIARDYRAPPSNAPFPDQNKRKNPVPHGGGGPMHVYMLTPTEGNVTRGASNMFTFG